MNECLIDKGFPSSNVPPEDQVFLLSPCSHRERHHQRRTATEQASHFGGLTPFSVPTVVCSIRELRHKTGHQWSRLFPSKNGQCEKAPLFGRGVSWSIVSLVPERKRGVTVHKSLATKGKRTIARACCYLRHILLQLLGNFIHRNLEVEWR